MKVTDDIRVPLRASYRNEFFDMSCTDFGLGNEPR